MFKKYFAFTVISMETNKRTNLLYSFYQALSEHFGDMQSLLANAMPLIEDYIGADRVFYYDWLDKKSVLSLKIMCEGKKVYNLQEDIFVDKNSPEIIKLLQDGVMDSPSLDYPAVYVLLKWRGPQNSIRTMKTGVSMPSSLGVFRVERLKKNKPFTESEKEILIELARELSSRINLTEVDMYHSAQLKRAEALNKLSAVFATSLRLSDSLQEILLSIQDAFRFDRTSLYLCDPKTNDIIEGYSVDLSGEVKTLEIGPNIKKKLVADASNSDIRLMIPLSVQGKNLGFMCFDNVLSRTPIKKGEVLSLKQFSSQIALAIDNARLFEKVQELSNYDDLTGLALRRFFKENLAQEIYRSKRFNLVFSLILLDIDYFKQINDTYGHLFGDEALKSVSTIIKESLRQTDLPCRYGGDEMVILLPRTTGEEAKHIAARLLKRVKEISLPADLSGGKEVKLSISQGIAVFPTDSDEMSNLFKCADDALYHVKQGGRGFYALYEDVKKK